MPDPAVMFVPALVFWARMAMPSATVEVATMALAEALALVATRPWFCFPLARMASPPPLVSASLAP